MLSWYGFLLLLLPASLISSDVQSPRCSCGKAREGPCTCGAIRSDPLCACVGFNNLNQTMADTFGAEWGKTCQAFMHRCEFIHSHGHEDCSPLNCRRGCYVNASCPGSQKSYISPGNWWSWDNCADDATEVATCPWTEQPCTRHEDCTYKACCDNGPDLVVCAGKDFSVAGSVGKCAAGKADDRCIDKPRGYHIDAHSWGCSHGRLDVYCRRKRPNESLNTCETKWPEKHQADAASGVHRWSVSSIMLLCSAGLAYTSTQL